MMISKNPTIDDVKRLNNVSHLEHVLLDFRKHSYMEVYGWCLANCMGYFIIPYTPVNGMRVCCFESSEDLTLFALKWG